MFRRLLAVTTCVVLGALPALAQSSGTLIVLNKSDDTVWLVDPTSDARRAELPTGRGPHEVAVSPDGRTAVVADYGDDTPGHTLTLIDLVAGTVSGTLQLAPHERPHGLAFLPDGKHLAVTSESSGALLLVDLAQEKVVAELPTAQATSHMVALLPDGSRAFVANIASGSVTAFDLATRERLAIVPTGAGAEGLDVTPDGRLLLVGNREADTLSFVDTQTLEEVAELPCASFPIRVKTTPDGKHALVSCAQSGDVALFDIAMRSELARIAMTGPPQGAEGAAPSGDRMFGSDFSEGPVPIGILITPDGRTAFIANTNADLVTVLDLPSRSLRARLPAGRQPDGLGWTPLQVPAASSETASSATASGATPSGAAASSAIAGSAAASSAAAIIASIEKLGGHVGRASDAADAAIVTVDLHATAVTDADLALLVGLSALHTLDLRATGIGDAGLVHLSALPALAIVLLDETKVTDAGRASLQAARPGLRFSEAKP